LSIKKINVKDAVYYVLAQILGGLVAFMLVRTISGVDTTMSQLAETSTRVALGEIVGMCMFAFGIASVVYGKVASHMNGIVVGISLLLGIMIASWIGSNGVLNPAVALGIGSFNLIYMLAPILGSILGFQAYNCLNKNQNQ
jgi:glycerol uptake facilitator-like aquaporin